MANHQVTQGVRTGGRSARVRQAILAATFDELLEHGYAGLRMDAVAARAGVNKTTVYRRWATLEDLLVDALATWSNDVPAPDTGRIETDLLAMGRELAGLLNGGVGRHIATLVLSAGLRSEELREATRRYFAHQVTRATPTINAAIERGELPPELDVDAVLTSVRAPLFYRVVTTGDHIDDALVEHTVQVTLASVRAGLLSTS